jgi:hypothetical protein
VGEEESEGQDKNHRERLAHLGLQGSLERVPGNLSAWGG